MAKESWKGIEEAAARRLENLLDADRETNQEISDEFAGKVRSKN